MTSSGNGAQTKTADNFRLRHTADSGEIDLSLPFEKRAAMLRQRLPDPRRYISSRGIKVTVNHVGQQRIDDVLLAHFVNAR